ncbi:MAG: hypothetical protein ABI461_12390 [Polyangiaceae bacterium]
MLREERAKGLSYDSTADLLVVTTGSDGAGSGSDKPFGHPKSVPLQLLLDAAGHLVGIDLGGEGMSRLVVMLGAHENVADTRNVVGMVHLGDDGLPSAIVISNARRVARAAEKNPYL